MKRTTSTSSRRRFALPAALAAVTIGLAGLPAAAVHSESFGVTGSSFEILDGDTDVDNPHKGTPSSIDWDSLTTTIATVKDDLSSGALDNSFGNGTKEDTPVPAVIDGSIPPNKSDLKSFGSYIEKNGSGQFLHLFWTRVQDPSGTTNMDFEFNKNACVVGGSAIGCSSNGVTPNRANRDLLITYDLSRGGTVPTISLRRWSAVTGTWGGETLLDLAVATGSINGSDISSSLTGESYSPRTFGEASINLASIFSTSVCESFGSAYLKSRSSDAFTSALKDFIAPVAVNVSNCGRLVVRKVAGSTTGSLLPGAAFTVNPANGATPPTTAMLNIGSGTPAANTGVFCLDSLRFGTTYTVTESTPPPGYDGAPAQTFTPTEASNSGTCSTVTGTTSAHLTFVNQLQTASMVISKTDDATPAAPLLGSTFTAYRDVAPLSTGAAAGAEDLAGTAAGSCPPTGSPATCTIASLPLGSYWVLETTTPEGYSTAAPQRITLAASGVQVNVFFVDPRLFKVITLVCKVADDSLYQASVAYNGGSVQNTLTGGTVARQEDLCNLGGATTTVNKSAAGAPHASTIAIN